MDRRLGLIVTAMAACGPKHIDGPAAPTDDHVQESAAWKRIAPGAWEFRAYGDATPTIYLEPALGERFALVVELPEGASHAQLTAIEGHYPTPGTGTFSVYPVTKPGVIEGESLASVDVAIASYQVWDLDAEQPRLVSTSFHEPVVIDARRFHLVFESHTGGPSIAADEVDSKRFHYQAPEQPMEPAAYSPHLRLRFTAVH